MKLGKIFGLAALALAVAGCSGNININQVKQENSGSGSQSVTIVNKTRQNQGIFVSPQVVKPVRRYSKYSYFYEADRAFVLSDHRIIVKETADELVAEPFQDDGTTRWRNIEDLTSIPESYAKEAHSFGDGTDDINFAVFYDAGKWVYVTGRGNTSSLGFSRKN